MKVITFDLWDTLFVDDSDEAERALAGLQPKRLARRELVAEATGKGLEIVGACYDAVDAAFAKVWHEEHTTWTVAERLMLVLQGLGISRGTIDFGRLVCAHERMELEFKPRLATGIVAALDALAAKYRLGVISDAIFSPGWALREILREYDLEKYFEVFVFSDQIGASKPAPATFKGAAAGFAVLPSSLIHIGDREQNDIAGPKGLGAQAVLSTVVIDRGSQSTQADAICADYTQLVEMIDALVAQTL